MGLIISHTHRRGEIGVLVDNLYVWVHVDKKLFYILKDGQGVYLHPTEDPAKPPHAQNNCCVTKVMFLVVVAHPRKLYNGVWLDGKIRIWSIVDTKVTYHSSKHHPKDTKVVVLSMMDEERHKKLIIGDVIPAIKAHMPILEGYTIFVQQDRAKSHT
ncbi:unnamed protein product [Choristocarpus tenellus]